MNLTGRHRGIHGVAQVEGGETIGDGDGKFTGLFLGNDRTRTLTLQDGEYLMDILISWSKTQSRTVAEAMREWLPKVLPDVKPWVSSIDIDKGTDWAIELEEYLAAASSCIICLSNKNVRSPWLYYEAGEIAAKGPKVGIYPYLLDIGPAMLSDGPLARRQCTTATKQETLQMILSMNKRLSSPHNADLLKGNFNTHWTGFEVVLKAAAEDDTEEVAASFIETEADEAAGIHLSSEARTLLLAAAAGDGHILMTRSSSGQSVQAGKKQFAQLKNARSEALWKSAVDELRHTGLIEDRGHQGEVFAVTNDGYKVADILNEDAEETTPNVAQATVLPTPDTLHPSEVLNQLTRLHKLLSTRLEGIAKQPVPDDLKQLLVLAASKLEVMKKSFTGTLQHLRGEIEFIETDFRQAANMNVGMGTWQDKAAALVRKLDGLLQFVREEVE